jgi:hypothetical protein
MQEADGLQSVLVLLSDDPSLRRARADLPAASGVCALIKHGRIVIASVGAGNHFLSTGKAAPYLPEGSWFHLALVFEAGAGALPSCVAKARLPIQLRFTLNV